MATVDVQGLKEAVRGLTALGADLADLKEGMARAGDLVADAARAAAPVRTGRYRASIRPTKTKNRVAIRAGGARVPYARKLERSRHVLADAATATAPAATAAVADTIRTLLNQHT